MNKKIVSLCLCVALIAVAAIGGTLAYFNDTKEVTNTFTSGDLEIKLDEAPLKEFDAATNHFIKDEAAERTEDGVNFGDEEIGSDVTPGAIIDKDPTVTNTGSENAYIAVVVDVDSPIEALKATWGGLGLTEIMSGGLADDTSWAFRESYHGSKWAWTNADGVIITQDPVPAGATGDDVTGYKMVYYFPEQFETDDDETLFTTLTIPSDWEEEDMEDLSSLTMDFTAYAVQGKGFTDVYEALHAAFPTVFDDEN